MPKKVNSALEKRERNEEYAKKFKSKKSGRQPSAYKNWCRAAGHPADCRCAYS